MSPLPILFLNIEQGPKAGCRLECNAAAIFTVGRARSNTLQISRDTGISQKHLRFQWSDSDIDDDALVGWTAIDAGSSNGTLINDVLVEPDKGILIRTGDLIKIGSVTTIRVEILDVADEVKAVPKAKESSKRTATCIAFESHGKSMSVGTGRHACKAGGAAARNAVGVQECEGKQMNVLEGEVSPGKDHIHDAENDGCGKPRDDTTNEVYLGKQHSTTAEGCGQQQDEGAGILVSGHEHATLAAECLGREGGNVTAHRCCQGKHDANNKTEGQGNQGCTTRAQVKFGINIVAKGNKQENSAKVSKDHEHETKVVASSGDIDLSMTVEQWFQHLMEEGPNYLYRVSESIIQDVMLESKQFDNYVLSMR